MLEKAILFAVANTLVCDDLDEAKHLSWTGQRFKGIIVDCSLQMLVELCSLFFIPVFRLVLSVQFNLFHVFRLQLSLLMGSY